jgi:hypothetical protein
VLTYGLYDVVDPDTAEGMVCDDCGTGVEQHEVFD